MPSDKKQHIKRFIIFFAAIIFCACHRGSTGVKGPKNFVKISGENYQVRTLSYEDGFYDFAGEECVRLHLEFTKNGAAVGAGMTVEVSKNLLDRRIAIEPSESFWFFHIGTGHASASLKNSSKRTEFGTRGGWFSVKYGDEPNEIILEWQLTGDNGKTDVSRGYLCAKFATQADNSEFVQGGEKKEDRGEGTILDGEYTISRARYEVLQNRITGKSVVNFYIDFTDGGGIIIEMAEELLGELVMIEQGSDYWFFSIAGGGDMFQSFKNTDRDFEGYDGWFYADLGENIISDLILFDITKNGQPFASGEIDRIFDRIN